MKLYAIIILGITGGLGNLRIMIIIGLGFALCVIIMCMCKALSEQRHVCLQKDGVRRF